MTDRALDPLRLPLGGTALIEASAGTGKTYTITTLFVRLLLERELGVEQILVVTFTRAATAELRERIRTRLLEVLRVLEGEDPGEDSTLQSLAAQRSDLGDLEGDRRKLRAALRGFDDAAIFTIHGFCQRMLQEHAFESGAGFDVELVTDLGPLIERCVHDFWARRVCSLPAPSAAFLQDTARKDAGVSFELLRKLAQRVAASPDMPVLPAQVTMPATPSSDADHQQVLLALKRELVDAVRDQLPRHKREARLQSFDDLLLDLRAALRGEAGALLAARIAARFGAALIDEFQDTDPVQYEVFQRIYAGTDLPLLLIGDPKQAIYSFRGADLFAYLRASRDAGRSRHSLDTNHRSDRPLVEAVNSLFARVPQPFVLDEIAFSPVQARHAARLRWPERGAAALELLFVPREEFKGARGFITVEKIGRSLPRLVAAEISRLLGSAARIDDDQGGERPVAPGDVAVLCRTNDQASDMQAALRELGVPSVLQAEASVLDSVEAGDLERIARALLEPERAAVLRAALSTRSLGVDAAELQSLQDDPSRWSALAQLFRRGGQLWQRRGFLAAFRQLLTSLPGALGRPTGVEARLLGFIDGERCLTNLQHLAELLQTSAVRDHLGPPALLAWLQRLRADRELRADQVGEFAQLRLESDDHAVKLVTIHKSKGLEYPVVYCPFLWKGTKLSGDDKRWHRFHDRAHDARLTLDLEPGARPRHQAWLLEENMAEQLRLLYVALTRARHRCSVVWGGFNDAGTSPLAYLLHQQEAADGVARMAATQKHFKTLKDDARMLAELEQVVVHSGGQLALREIDTLLPGPPHRPAQQEPGALRTRQLPAAPPPGWSLASFSALTQRDLGDGHPAAAGLDHDAEAPVHAALAPAPGAGERVLLHAAPRGAGFGNLVHRALELLDFERADPATLAALLQRLDPADRQGRRALGDHEILIEGLGQVLDTELSGVAPGFTLRGLSGARCLNEMEFALPVAPARLDDPRATAALEPAALARAVADHSDDPELRRYAARIAGLGFAPLAGYLRGVVDLVFVHEQRWYIADYKTNDLGSLAGDYAPEHLGQAMAQHHYHLQALLYAVALHRHLTRHQPDYQLERDFGGVLYLFLRGMSPDATPGCGVHASRPAPALITALDALLAQDPVVEVTS